MTVMDTGVRHVACGWVTDAGERFGGHVMCGPGRYG